ncbi:TPA: glycosyl transferase family 1, partial [Streptococcus pneumoniae]|nr:glycosyl transferase family 1 [Streptococcus pneumoniae]HEV4708462.1 glycosyl transferase family 1 [Streptococcus pneumoniae]
NNFQKDLAKDDTVSQRIFKTVLYLQQQVVAVPVKGSRRMLKASKTQLISMRDYWKDHEE